MKRREITNVTTILSMERIYNKSKKTIKGNQLPESKVNTENHLDNPNIKNKDSVMNIVYASSDMYVPTQKKAGGMSLDDFQQIEDVVIEPIYVSNLVDIQINKEFLIRFNKLTGNKIKEGTIEEDGKRAYSILEICYLIFLGGILDRPYLKKKRKVKDKTGKEIEIDPFEKLRHLLINYTRRAYILDRFISSLNFLKLNTLELDYHRATLVRQISSRNIYIPSFFNGDLNPISDIEFLYKRTNEYTKSYQAGLSFIHKQMCVHMVHKSNMDFFLEYCSMLTYIQIKDKGRDIEYFKYFYNIYSRSGDFRLVPNLNNEQRMQLESYFVEIGLLMNFIVINTITTKGYADMVRNLVFIQDSIGINKPLHIFHSENTCSTTVFSKIITYFKLLTKQLLEYFNKFYALDPQVYLGAYIQTSLKKSMVHGYGNLSEQVLPPPLPPAPLPPESVPSESVPSLTYEDFQRTMKISKFIEAVEDIANSKE